MKMLCILQFFLIKLHFSLCHSCMKLLGTAQDVKALVARAAKLEDAPMMVMFCGKRLGEMTTLEQTGIAHGDVLQVMVFPKK